MILTLICHSGCPQAMRKARGPALWPSKMGQSVAVRRQQILQANGTSYDAQVTQEQAQLPPEVPLWLRGSQFCQPHQIDEFAAVAKFIRPPVGERKGDDVIHTEGTGELTAAEDLAKRGDGGGKIRLR
jgi:hypothetical protein